MFFKRTLGQVVWHSGVLVGLVVAALPGWAQAPAPRVAPGWVSPSWLLAPETLTYRVQWGPLTMGRAVLAYTPGPARTTALPYSIAVQAQDSVSLVELDNRYVATGQHRPGTLFFSQTYRAVQTENDYRADKTVAFGRRQITYQNNLDAADTMAPLPRAMNGEVLHDVFSSIYHLRARGLGAIQQGGRVRVMGTKRPFTLRWPVLKQVEQNGQKLWRVPLQQVQEDGRVSTDTWVVYLQNNAQLTPELIVANLRFGSFRAVRTK